MAKHYFYWTLKSPPGKSPVCDIRNTSEGGEDDEGGGEEGKEAGQAVAERKSDRRLVL